jgi:hypothetical protein
MTVDDIFDAEREPEAAALHALAGYEWAWAMRRKDREEFRYVYVTIVMQTRDPRWLITPQLMLYHPGIRVVKTNTYDFARKVAHNVIVDMQHFPLCTLESAITQVLGRPPVPGIPE